MWYLLIISIIIWIFCALYLVYVLFYQITRREVFVPFIPADAKGIDAMCKAVDVKGTEKVIDIGSGWGTILFYLVRKYPKLNLTGIELNPILHFIAKLRRYLFHNTSKMRLLKGDAAKYSFAEYEIVFLFMLSPFVNKILVPKFEKELKKGAKVVSYVFRMTSKAFKETQILLPAHGWRSAVYIYEKITD